MAQRSKIRPATAKDAELLKTIYKECKKELGSFNLYQCWEHYLSGKNNERFDIIPGVGFVRWGWSKKYQSNVIKDIGVLRSEHGNGYGAELARVVPPPVLLKCNEDNVCGNDFYKFLGMHKSGRTFTKNGNPQTIWTCVEW